MKALPRLSAAIALLIALATTPAVLAAPRATPYVTGDTHYMVLPKITAGWGGITNISNVYEGIFYVQQGNRLTFILDDGRCLFDDEWELPTYDYLQPRFNSGAAVVKKKLPGWKYQYQILYADGRMKEMAPTVKFMTQFCDGLALMQNGDSKWSLVDINGNPVFTHLTVGGEEYQQAIRPLCQGLRGFKSAVDMWGFIDDQGNIKIAPQFEAVKDFHEGYALVLDNDGPALINTKGEKQFGVKTYCSPADLYKLHKFGDMHDGSINIDGTFYDAKGSILKECNSACPFRDGVAFVSLNYKPALIDKNMNVVRIFADGEVSGSDIEKISPYPSGYMPTYSGENVFNHLGEHILGEWAQNYGANFISRFSAFNAYETSVFEGCVNGKNFAGFILPSGQVTWIFTEQAFTDEDWRLIPTEPIPGPKPPLPLPVPPHPTPYPPVEKIGPTVKDTVKYHVTVVCTPTDGGSASVTGGPEYHHGDSVSVIATPNTDWRCASIKVNGKAIKGSSFAIVNDTKVEVHFIKKDIVDAPAWTNCYQGVQKTDFDGVPFDLTFYGEISAKPDIATPYGDNTYGFVVAMFDPSRRFESKDVSTYIFAAPFRIVGYQNDVAAGKQYMVLDAGSISFGKIVVKTGNPLMAAYVNGLMAVNGYTSPAIIRRRYRVEMLNVDPQSGEFDYGVMQTYSAEHGWLNADDSRLKKRSKGFMMDKTDNGLPPDFFAGVRFAKAPKRTDVQWYPPALWYDDNQSIFDDVINALREAYRTYQSAYAL
ncbi:MAG: WG repeat-containing protein, partial [Muribaculaceae bacterium]